MLVGGSREFEMTRADDGYFEAFVEGLGARELYQFSLSGGARVPDPASRFQPEGVNGPSETIDPSAFQWRQDWAGRRWEDFVLYELHLGAFTQEGTFEAAAARLDHLADLGVTAIEIMPVGAFPGRWNWGYDGAFPYAPDASYGRPDDFKALIDAAHQRGLAVILDVVYNHFGPQGNYLSAYAPGFFNPRHKTPWGDAINFDGPDSRPVREYFIQNAEFWIEEFRLDGLRLDAVHAIKDESRPDLLEELAERVRTRFKRPICLLLENEDNDPRRLDRRGHSLRSYTAQWNDDLHHVLHVAATREGHGYYAAYGDTERLARAIAEGFAYQGEFMPYRKQPRGGPSASLPPDAFVAFIQNHDQIGNRAFGERLTVLVAPEQMRALASVYLIIPQIPMLFMGEEWGARQPFPFFCDFDGDLAEAVRKGRREEFSRFPEFVDGERADAMPDPLAETTFLAAKLDWDRIDASHLAYYRALLATRRKYVQPILSRIERAGEARVYGDQAVRVTWRAGNQRLVLDANLSPGDVDFPEIDGLVFWRCGDAARALGPWSVRWSAQAS